MSTENNPYFHCYCRDVIDELIHFSREISSVKSQRLKWERFREFTIHFPSRFSRINGDINRMYVRTPCEQNIYIGLYDVFTRKNIGVSTLILNAIAFHYFKGSHYHFQGSSFLRYLQEGENFDRGGRIRLVLTALNGQPQFMKLLLDLDLLNLDGDTWRLGFAASKILEEFVLMEADVSSRDREAKAVEILKLAIDVFFPGMCNEKVKRICLTTFCIKVVLLKLKKQEKEANDYFHCLRMYFAATRDPFVTLNEMRSLLYACLTVLKTSFFQRVLQEDHHRTMEMYYDEFVKLMPYSSAKIQPRNLTDLARCEIRKNLNKNNPSLPEAVQKLRLPQEFKKFILGDVFDMSRVTGNVSMEEIITIPQLADLLSSRRPKRVLVSPYWSREQLGKF